MVLILHKGGLRITGLQRLFVMAAVRCGEWVDGRRRAAHGFDDSSLREVHSNVLNF